MLVLVPTRRQPRAAALRRAQPREVRRHVLHRPQQGRAVGGPAARRGGEREPLRVDCRVAAGAGAPPSPPALQAAGGAGARAARASAATEALARAAAAGQAERDQELATFLSEMRLIKDAGEVRALRSAMEATKRGFEDVIARLKPRAANASSRACSDARAHGGQRRRLRHDRRLRRARLHAALDAQRRRHPQGRPAAARRRRRGPLALHRRHHAHAADLGPLHARAARHLRARAGRAARRARAG